MIVFKKENKIRQGRWWPIPDLNRRPNDYESSALTN